MAALTKKLDTASGIAAWVATVSFLMWMLSLAAALLL
jgi:hypothetical protein